MTKDEYKKITGAYTDLSLCYSYLELLIDEKMLEEKYDKSIKYFPKGGLCAIKNRLEQAFIELEGLIIKHKIRKKI